ncbi:hypothetical protein KGP95_22905 [Burkholderia multivorans]|uniref:hypothetical protein n=1 Tax=Burkholderia multivorans TaxID=87883 RepID=UPI0020A0FD6B|nr:hypothetical protein [Burkholderia multivorans]MCO8591037.1 hypothetical protein [Burkholderia multivorans]MCO8609955.1 hypothetical protein [Burkholderia multivorans]MCO8640187.1 hypothetical protein [Burkholderia multivorans]
MKGTHASPEYDERSRAFGDEAAAPRLARPIHRARADAIGICPPIPHAASHACNPCAPPARGGAFQKACRARRQAPQIRHEFPSNRPASRAATQPDAAAGMGVASAHLRR